MRWGPAAATDRDSDLVFDEREQFGAPLELMLAPEPDQRDPIGKKLIPGKWSPADDADQADDQSIAWSDWSLGMTFGRLDRIGRGGYSYGIEVDARDPRRIMPPGKVTYPTMPASGFTHAPIRAFQEFGSHVYCVTGPDSATPAATSDILRLVDGDDTVVVSGRYQSDTAPYFSGRSLLQYRGHLYVGGYNGFLRRKMNTANDPDDGPLDDTSPGDGSGWDEYAFQRVFLAKQKWKVAGIEDFYIVANDTDYTIVYTSADPTTDGNWSSPVGVVQGDNSVLTYIGDERYKIKSVATSNGRMWWGKTDGMWDTNSNGISSNATPFVEDCLDDTNCAATSYHDGYVYFWTSMGFMRMATSDRVRIDVPQNVQPGFGRPVEGPIYGTVTCNPTSDNGWLVVPIYNGADSFLLYAQDPNALGIDLPIPLVWHGALAHFPGKKITALGKTSLTGWPHMLIGLWDPIADTASIAKQQMLKNGSAYQSWQRGDDYRFQTRWKIVFTAEDLGLPNTRKALLRGDATTENTTTSRKVEVYTGLDQTTWAEETSDGDPFYILTPPISGTYTLSVAGYGTTGSLAYTDGAATIQAALEAISGLSGSVIASVHGQSTFKVTLLSLPASALLTASGQASLAYHLMGTALTAPRQAFVPSRFAPTGFVISNRVEGTGTDAEPAMLTSLKYRLSLIEDQLEEREYTVRFGYGVTNRRGISDMRDPQALLQRLVTYMNRGALEFVDHKGHTISGKVRSGLKYMEIEHDGGYESRVTFRVKIQRQPFYWGAGATWSDVFSWS
jgi:hypothetical protein